MPEPIVIPWAKGRSVRIRHDDPHLSTYTVTGQQTRCAMLLASDLEGLRLALARGLVHGAGALELASADR